mmetsp:Transcript_30358/g.65247  ORF Transcript_30358/g.65247 Transcript_30358/m.65247 type:complete len:209 (+) Transcript_30358:491-1117(+)
MVAGSERTTYGAEAEEISSSSSSSWPPSSHAASRIGSASSGPTRRLDVATSSWLEALACLLYRPLRLWWLSCRSAQCTQHARTAQASVRSVATSSQAIMLIWSIVAALSIDNEIAVPAWPTLVSGVKISAPCVRSGSVGEGGGGEGEGGGGGQAEKGGWVGLDVGRSGGVVDGAGAQLPQRRGNCEMPISRQASASRRGRGRISSLIM